MDGLDLIAVGAPLAIVLLLVVALVRSRGERAGWRFAAIAASVAVAVNAALDVTVDMLAIWRWLIAVTLGVAASALVARRLGRHHDSRAD